MNIIELKEREDISENVKLARIYIQFQELLKELRKRELPEKIIDIVNQRIEGINSTTLTGNELGKLVKKKQTEITKMLEKELKIVPKNHYRNLWSVLGMSIFGLPIGVVYGTIIGNMAMLAIGLPIGMAIGIGLGARLDKKAFKEGRQLEVEIKY
jgi:hypothetical protein